MADSLRTSKIVIVVGLIALFLGAITLFVMESADSSRSEIPVFSEIPNFSGIESFGSNYVRADLNEKITIVDFIFTSCPALCPSMCERMSELYELYAENEEIQFLSMSVDPANDSLPALREFSNRFGVTDNRWKFVRMSLEEVTSLYTDGFKLGGELPFQHSSKFILVDRSGRIRGYYESGNDQNIETLKSDITELLNSGV